MATARIFQLTKSLPLRAASNWLTVRAGSTKMPETAHGHLSHVQKVVSTSDGTAFVAWHPTTEFPYEYSRPLPPPAIETSTLIKDQAIDTAMVAFGQKKLELARKELMRITHTHVITWCPKRTNRRKKPVPRQRKYL